MMYNRLELLLLNDEYYDKSFQPLKDRGIYVVTGTQFCVYGKRWSVKALSELVDEIVNYRIKVEAPFDLYQGNPYNYFEDYSMGDGFIEFKFIFVPRGEEHLFLTYEEDCKVISIGTLENKKVLSVAETKQAIIDGVEFRRVSNLESIANWRYSPNDFFNGFAISSFAAEHYKNKTVIGIKREYKRLAKMHHPDVHGGEELMFRAITRAKEYLIGNIEGTHIEVESISA